MGPVIVITCPNPATYLSPTRSSLAAEYADLAHETRSAIGQVSKDLDDLTNEVRYGFRRVYERLNTPNLVKASHSLPPRAYTLPVTDTGSVDIDKLQDQVDKMVADKQAAEVAAAAVASHIKRVKDDADARLKKYTAIMSILVAVGTILGAIVSHLAH